MRFSRKTTALAGALLSLVVVPGACSRSSFDDAGHAGAAGKMGVGQAGDGVGQGGDGSFAAGLGGASAQVPESPLEFRQVEGSALDSGTDFVFLPDSREVLQLDREGHFAHLRLEPSAVTLLARFSFQEDMVLDDACVPTNILLDPGFTSNAYLYVTYCAGSTKDRLVRYRWDKSEGLVEPATILELSQEQANSHWHRFGSMGFEDDSVLWIFTGDHSLPSEAQNTASPFGSLLRIIPNRETEGSGHGYPRGNLSDWTGPFADVDPAVYAYGFRTPWRATRDVEGRFWVGDVGEDRFEEVNRVQAMGENFGWPLHEGVCEFPCDGFVEPVAHYGDDADDRYLQDDAQALEDERRAIWVGQLPAKGRPDLYGGLLKSTVVFGDFFTGIVRGLTFDEEGQVVADDHLGHLPLVVSWRVAADGRAYALDVNGSFHEVLLSGETRLD
jgi:hypothetical protein